MIATDTNLKRMMQQLQNAANQGLRNRSQAFGLAVSFLTTTFAVANQIARSTRPYSPAVETAHRTAVAAAIAGGELVVALSAVHGTETTDDAHLRHLRNCFAHGNWRYDESVVTPTHMPIRLEDFNHSGQTFAADIQLPAVVNLAERLLVDTFNAIP